MSTESLPRYVSLNAAANALDVDVVTLRRRIARGELEAVRLGDPPRRGRRDNRPIRVPVEAIEKLLHPVTVARP